MNVTDRRTDIRPQQRPLLRIVLRGNKTSNVFRLDALVKAWSVIATATWLGGCHTPVLYHNR